MAKPLTEEQRQQIIDLLPTGRSCNDIAKQVGRSPDTVSRIAKSVGHAFGHMNLARAHEVRRAYGVEARARRVALAHERMLRILERMGQPHTRYHFGGKDNTLNSVELDEPDSEMLRQYASAYASLSKAEADTLRHDERSDDVDRASGLIVDLVESLRSPDR